MAYIRWRRIAMASPLAATFCCSVNAQTETTYQSKLSGYLQTVLCVVANGHARGERLDAGDKEKALRYENQMKVDYMLAQAQAKTIGLGPQRVSEDLAGMEKRELPKMFKDKSYYYEVVANCKYLKFM